MARLDAPRTWLPAVENHGEGFFFSFKSSALERWEQSAAVDHRAELFEKAFQLWQRQREDRKNAKADFIAPRFVPLHSLAHLLITAVSLDCGYAASSVRERIHCGVGGDGILLQAAPRRAVARDVLEAPPGGSSKTSRATLDSNQWPTASEAVALSS